MSNGNTQVSRMARVRNMVVPAVLAGATVVAIAITSAVAAHARRVASELSPALRATRAALDKYQDPMAAVRDGYFSTVACIEFRAGNGATEHEHMAGHMAYMPGAMGVHFLNPANIGSTLDSLKPQVLLYEPVGDKLRLVGAEWFAPVAVAKTAPTIFGQTLMGPMEGHPPIMPASLHHWDLHVWLWKDNPAGVFSPTNARVKCPEHGYGYSFDDEPPKVVRP